MDEGEPSGNGWAVGWRRSAPFVLIAITSLVLQGQLGRITTWMDGDMQYHRGVALSIFRAGPIGEGPYEGLPSYLTGIYHYALALVAGVGWWPDTVVSVVSWIEPIVWMGAAYFLAARLWRRIPTRAVFVVLVMFGAGIGSGPGWAWVDAVTLSGHVYWPLFPRDVAFILLMVGIGIALRDRPVIAGIIAGLTIGVHPQIGAVAALWAATTILIGRDRLELRRSALTLLVAGLASVWYWLPRVALLARLGGFRVEDFRIPLPATPANLWLGFGLLLPIALAGAVVGLKGRRRPSIVGTAWIAALIAPVAVTTLVGSELLTTRRTLLLLALPVLVLVTELARWLTTSVADDWGRVVPALLLVPLVVLSIPFHRSTRSILERIWQHDRYAVLEYPLDAWTPVLEEISARSAFGSVLVPERDAPIVWYLTGSSVAWMKRPGFVKTGFDVGAATGWSEDDREAEVVSAFAGGLPEICALMEDRMLETAVLRSERGLIGTFDWIPAADQRRRPSDDYEDLNKYDVVHVPAGTPIEFEPPSGVRRVDAWYLEDEPESRVGLGTDETILNAVRITADGRARKATFELSGVESPLRLGFTDDVTLLRVVGYTPFPGADAPAVVLDRRTVCGPGSS